MPPPSLPPARASDTRAAAAAAAASAFAMRPGALGPLWPLPWGALAWAVGFVGSVGSGDPVPGEWGGRKGRARRATHVGLPGMRPGAGRGAPRQEQLGQRAVTSGRLQVEPGRAWGSASPSPKGPEGGSPGGQQNRCGSQSGSRRAVRMTADIYGALSACLVPP